MIFNELNFLFQQLSEVMNSKNFGFAQRSVNFIGAIKLDEFNVDIQKYRLEDILAEADAHERACDARIRKVLFTVHKFLDNNEYKNTADCRKVLATCTNLIESLYKQYVRIPDPITPTTEE